MELNGRSIIHPIAEVKSGYYHSGWKGTNPAGAATLPMYSENGFLEGRSEVLQNSGFSFEVKQVKLIQIELNLDLVILAGLGIRRSSGNQQSRPYR